MGLGFWVWGFQFSCSPFFQSVRGLKLYEDKLSMVMQFDESTIASCVSNLGFHFLGSTFTVFNFPFICLVWGLWLYAWVKKRWCTLINRTSGLSSICAFQVPRRLLSDSRSLVCTRLLIWNSASQSVNAKVVPVHLCQLSETSGWEISGSKLLFSCFFCGFGSLCEACEGKANQNVALVQLD